MLAAIRNLTLRTKTTLIVLGLLIIVSTMSHQVIRSLIERNAEATRTIELLNVAHSLDNIAHYFALERGLSEEYKSSSGEVTKQQLLTARKEADQAAEQWHNLALKYPDIESTFSEQKQLLARAIDHTIMVREFIDHGVGEYSFKHYSGLIEQALTIYDVIVSSIESPDLIEDLLHHVHLLWLKERAGQSRGILNGIFAAPEQVISNDKMIDASFYIRSFDIVFMDCQMPVMDGFEATTLIRQPDSQVADPNVIIIAMTANAMQGDRERCLEVGMDDYITKPINSKMLLATLEKWIASARQSA